MKREIVIACDVDGVINALGDENFSRADMQEKMLFDVSGRPRVNLTFSPTTIQELNALAQRFPFFMLTSWNARVEELRQAGLKELPFLEVERNGADSERDSKLKHVAKLAAENRYIIWIDDFAKEWFHLLPRSVQDAVFPIQPHHHQGIQAHDMRQILDLVE